MKGKGITLFTVLAFHYGNAQFHYHLTSTPDSAIVKMNGVQTCYTPCLLKFDWKEYQNSGLVISVSAAGFESWSDTIRQKPDQLDRFAALKLERRLPSIAHDSLKAVVGFDRLLADFNEGRPVGFMIDKNSKADTIKWEGETKIGAKEFEDRFLEILKKVGYRIPERQEATLFSDNNTKRYTQPRYVVGAKVLDYRAYFEHDRPKVTGAGNLKGRTYLKLEWQVLDRATGNVVLKEITEGHANYREERKQFRYANNLVAFEQALVAFLENGNFYRLLKESKGQATMDGDSSTEEEFTIPDLPTPPYRNTSEMIKAADRSSATISTDNGHGSGVIIGTDGYVLSAYHVVEGSAEIKVHLSNGLKQQAIIKAFDRKYDVVLLQITGSGYSSAPIGESDSLSLGDELITIGTPADLSLGQSVARGILSGRRSIDEQVYLQTDMAVSPGNSGGPVFNSRGELIGIIQRKLVGTGIEGIGFAIPIEDALRVLGIHVE